MFDDFNFRNIPLFIPVSAGIAVGTLTSFYVYRKYVCQRYFRRRGIPGPEPHWLYGNFRELQRTDRFEVLAEWSRKYGDIYGYYEGPTPILVTSNLDAVEQICATSQFPHFNGHNVKEIHDLGETDSLRNGELWKRLRTSLSPAFSTEKVESYEPLIAETQAYFMELLDEKNICGESFDCRTAFQLLTLDLIAKVGFGLDFKAVKTKGKGNPILKALREISDKSFQRNKAMEILRIFPSLAKKKSSHLYCITLLLEAVSIIITNRLGDEKSGRNDLLQLMIDSSDLIKHDNDTDVFLCEREIKAVAVLFFFAGYETTSSILAHVAYCLATNQHVQDRLSAEIYSKFPKETVFDLEPDYETVMNQMPYLDWVCRETLRLYPIGFGVINFGETEFCGTAIDKNCASVLVDVWTIHQSRALWGSVDPRKFYPERFSPDNSVNRPKYAFLAFGYGPHQCIGQQLALFEMKLTLVNLLHRFRIVEPDGGYPAGGLKLSSCESALIPIKLVRRD